MNLKMEKQTKYQEIAILWQAARLTLTGEYGSGTTFYHHNAPTLHHYNTIPRTIDKAKFCVRRHTFIQKCPAMNGAALDAVKPHFYLK